MTDENLNKFQYQKKLIALLMTVIMAISSLWGMKPGQVKAEEEGTGIITIVGITRVLGDSPDGYEEDDMGNLCKLTDIKKIIVMSNADDTGVCEITGDNPVGSSSLEIVTMNDGYVIVDTDATLKAGSIRGYLKSNKGDIFTDSLDFSASLSGGDYPELTNEGDITVKGALAFSSQGGKILNKGTLEAGSLILSAESGEITNQGKIDADSIEMNGTSLNVINESGAEISTQSLQYTGLAKLSNDGLVEADSLSLYATGGSYFTEFSNNTSGVLETTDLNCSDFTIGEFANFGTVKAKTVHMTPQVEYYDTAVYEVSESYTTSGFNSEYIGKVKAGPFAKISGTGGTVPLSVNGSDYEFVTIPSEKTDAYLLVPLPIDCFEKADGTNYLALSGVNQVDETYYAKDSITLTPHEGYKVMPGIGGYDFADSVTLTKEDLYPESNGGYFYSDLTFYLIDQTNGLFSKQEEYYNLISSPDLENIIFDEEPPNLTVTSAVADEAAVSLADGDTITAKKLTVSIRVSDDDTYPDLTVDTSLGKKTLTLSAEEKPVLDLTFEAVPGEKKEHYITVKDLSGNETTLSFDLVYAKDEVAATVSADDLFVGETVEPVVVTKSGGTVTFQYKKEDDPDTAYTDTVPTAAGRYYVKATIAETALYDEIICVSNTPFEIKKKNVTAEITVGSIYVGETLAPKVTCNSGGTKTVEYKLSSDPEEKYSELVPTKAGTYSARATIGETAEYKGTTCETEFTISKKDVTASVTVSDIFVGEKISPTVTTVSTGTRSFAYKEEGDSDYSATAPTAAGSYYVRVTIAETDEFSQIVCYSSTPFKISKKSVSATISVADILVGGTVDPKVTCVSDGIKTIEFKLYSDPEEKYTETVPELAGKYSVRVTVAETAKYEEAVAETSFTISRKTTTATVSVAGFEVGGTAEPKVTTNSDGEAVIEYKKFTDPDTAYAETAPTKAGKWSVRATLPETDMYEGYVCENTFTISRKTPAYATVTVNDITVGEVVTPSVNSDSDGAGKAEFKYKRSADTEYSETVPTAAGEYDIYAFIPETDTYEATDCTGSFTISKKEASASVTVSNSKVGMDYEPVITTDSDGKSMADIAYKADGAPDEAYNDEKPVYAGSYRIRVTVPETDTYEKVICYGSFTISKNTPTTATVLVADLTVGETVTPVVTTDSDGKEETTFLFRLKDEDDEKYTDTVPTAAGEYVILATIPETQKYEMITCQGSFTISKVKSATSKVEVSDTTVGTDYEPVLTTDSDGKLSAVFEYKRAEDPDTAWSETKPAKAGTWLVRVTIPATAKYEQIICENEFIISKKTPSVATVTAADIIVGGTVEPSVTTDSDGKASFEFKKDGDTTYSATVPTAAGSYSIRATIAETDKFSQIVCYSTTPFMISKKTTTASISVADIQVGGTVDPKVTCNSNGTKTVEFKLSSDPAEKYSEEVPTKAGTYSARATISETAEYQGTTCETEFTISKKDVTASVTVSDIFVGETISSTVTTDSTGARSFAYKEEGHTDYSATVPTAAGSYYIRVTIAETDEYNQIVCYSSTPFKISKKSASATVSVADILVGGTADPKVTTDSDGKAEIRYKRSVDTEYSETVPTAAGEYDIHVFIPETDTYEATECTGSFTIRKKEASASVTVSNSKVGMDYEPVISTDSDGKSMADVAYKADGAPDEAYNDEKPVYAGSYRIRVTVPATDTYETVVCYGSFTISKNTPATAKVIVADLTVGETVKPVVITDSDGKEQTTFLFRLREEGDDKYTETVPTEIGEYVILATIPETQKYEMITCQGSFTISKVKQGISKVEVPDTTVGTYFEPILTTDSDGKSSAVFEYKRAGDPDTAWSKTKPAKAGTWAIRVTIPATAKYDQIICESIFTISKKVPSIATVAAADIIVGEKVVPVVTTDSNGKADFRYKKEGDPDTAWSATEPTAAGSYYVMAVIEETDEYSKVICYSGAPFKISKKTALATIRVEDIHVGETEDPKVTCDSDGEVIFEYKLFTDPDGRYDGTVPTAAGRYSVRATVAETANFEKAVCETSFIIRKIKPESASVSVADIKVGDNPDPIVKTDSDGTKVIEYKRADAGSNAFRSAVPDKAGTYTIRVSILESDTYEPISCESSFTISKRKAEASVSLENPLAGTTYTPVISSESDGVERAEFRYCRADDRTASFSKEQPKSVGSYVVRADIPETDMYLGVSCSVEYQIRYLDAPATSYVIKANLGANKFYIEDVRLDAPDGFLIAASHGGPFVSSLDYSADLTSIYLKRKIDSALTDVIELGEIKIDKLAPMLLTTENENKEKVSIASGSIVYEDMLLISIEDENLAFVRIDGIGGAVQDHRADIILSAEGGSRNVTIVAEDLAGNLYELSFTLAAKWKKNNHLPAGMKVHLEKGVGYELEEGTWRVNGDPTSYSGGQTVYVRETNDYTFSQN